jgi:nitrate reductase gamma subunit
MATLLWLVPPYLVLGAFVLGRVWHWRHDQFGWNALNTPLIGNRLMRLGSPLVHVGVLAVSPATCSGWWYRGAGQRRVRDPSVGRTTTVMDVVMYLVLGMVVLLGIWRRWG